MKRWKLWTKILFVEGLTLLGFGFGWAMGTRAGAAMETPFFLIALGSLGLLGSLALWRLLVQREGSARSQGAGLAVIDLEDSVRAYRGFGSQPPLWEHGELVRSELRTLEPRSRWENLSGPCIVEHWKGASSIELQVHPRTASLQEKQVVYVGPEHKDFSLRIEGSAATWVLIHFLSSPEVME